MPRGSEDWWRPDGRESDGPSRVSDSAWTTTASAESMSRVRTPPACFGVDPLFFQFEVTCRLVTRVLQSCESFNKFRLGRRDCGGRGSDRLSRALELRLGAANGEQILMGVDTEQDFPRLKALIGADADLDHPAADFRGDVHHICLHQSLRRIGRDAIGDDAVDEQHGADHDHDLRHAAYRACRQFLALGARRN